MGYASPPITPNLLHPVPITIEQLETAETAYDEDAREPIQQATHGSDIVVPGQVHWTGGDQLSINELGATDEVTGYVLFRVADLRAAGITKLLRGDRFESEGNLISEVYVIRTQPCAHYPGAGGPTLVKAWFHDRKPSKERR